MPSKREILARLSREELVAVVERFELSVADRRKKDALVEGRLHAEHEELQSLRSAKSALLTGEFRVRPDEEPT
jgi:hypothetical protein